MRFLIDADLPRATGESLRRAGHDAFDVRDIGLGDAKDSKIAAYARAHQLCLLTVDFDFADIRNYPPHLYAGIVVLTIPRHATVAFILQLVDIFLQQTAVLTRLPGRLAIVEPGRVRMRSS
ncbi:MAG: DUF5615 family PIN-like protein [Desulfurellaceae bacterium]|nr:DUF5615 family PIN-like protein [Desulfurellaceae bacterium]